MPLDEFIRSQSARIARIASRLWVPADLIRDVVQAVWLDAARNRVTFSGEHAAQERCAWLNRVALMKSVDALRDTDRHPAESLDAQPGEQVDKDAKDALKFLQEKESHARLAAALVALLAEDPVNGRLLIENYLGGRSIQDLAEESGLTGHAIDCRISRALTKLRRLL